ncbi:PadR family transcriptional regulator [Modestobacter sp. SYSU DS0657]
MTAESAWPSEWVRGVLDVCVLRVLRDGPTYGYAIAARLAGSGLGTLKGGTLYPLLGRLERTGLVTAEWRPGEGGPGRKYYRLTGAGHEELRHAAGRWSDFTDVTRNIITGAQAPAGPAAEETP